MVVAWAFKGLVLRAFDDIEPHHFVLNLLFEFFEVYDQLVAILVESWPVFAWNQAVHLELLVDHCLNLLHGLQDQEPRLDIEHMTEAVRDVEESLADEYVALSDRHLVFPGSRGLEIDGCKRPSTRLLFSLGRKLPRCLTSEVRG